jgi:hypothetical protein
MSSPSRALRTDWSAISSRCEGDGRDCGPRFGDESKSFGRTELRRGDRSRRIDLRSAQRAAYKCCLHPHLALRQPLQRSDPRRLYASVNPSSRKLKSRTISFDCTGRRGSKVLGLSSSSMPTSSRLQLRLPSRRSFGAGHPTARADPAMLWTWPKPRANSDVQSTLERHRLQERPGSRRAALCCLLSASPGLSHPAW